MAETSVTEESKRIWNTKYAGATFLVMTAVATFIPVFMAKMMNLDVVWTGHFSTGGLVTLASAVILGFVCKEWRTWWSIIWVPICVLVVIAYFVLDSSYGGANKPEQPAPATTQAGPTCFDYRSDLAALDEQVDAMSEAAWQAAGSAIVSTRVPTPPVERVLAPGERDWSTYGPDPAIAAWEHFSASGGPSYEAERQRVQNIVDTDCQ